MKNEDKSSTSEYKIPYDELVSYSPVQRIMRFKLWFIILLFIGLATGYMQ